MILARKLLLLTIIVFVVSCRNPFNPGFQEEKVKRSFLEPDTPENVLKNLMVAYNLKSIDIYKDTLDKDFRFYINSQNEPIIGQDWWGYEQEIEYHNNLFSRGSSDGSLISPNNISLHLEIPPPSMWQLDNKVGQENWLIIACYFNLQLSYIAGADISASGFARFYLKQVDDRWYIAIWMDESYT